MKTGVHHRHQKSPQMRIFIFLDVFHIFILFRMHSLSPVHLILLDFVKSASYKAPHYAVFFVCSYIFPHTSNHPPQYLVLKHH